MIPLIVVENSVKREGGLCVWYDDSDFLSIEESSLSFFILTSTIDSSVTEDWIFRIETRVSRGKLLYLKRGRK